ncbi:unnamed protein product, partial [Ectocarpus sp. 8 AP-2014]
SLLVNAPTNPPEESPSAPTKQIQTNVNSSHPKQWQPAEIHQDTTPQKRLTLPRKEHSATEGHLYAPRQCRGRLSNATTLCARTTTPTTRCYANHLCGGQSTPGVTPSLSKKHRIYILFAQGYILKTIEASTKSVFFRNNERLGLPQVFRGTLKIAPPPLTTFTHIL